MVSMDFGSKQNHFLQLSVRSVSRFEALEFWIISQSNLKKTIWNKPKKLNVIENQNTTTATTTKKTIWVGVFIEREKTAGETRWLHGFTPKRKVTKIKFLLCRKNQGYQSEWLAWAERVTEDLCQRTKPLTKRGYREFQLANFKTSGHRVFRL